MKLFIKKAFLFSLVYIVYLTLACWIDPYNLIHKENNSKLIELERQVAYPLNEELYKLQAFTQQPTDVVLLGDSRTRSLNISTFERLTRMKTTNLAFGAAAISDITETFWYITRIHNVKEIYIGINFNLYNGYYYSTRVKEAIKLIESPQSYIFSKYCYKSLYLILKSYITGEVTKLTDPGLSKEQFWKFQLDSTAAFYYRNYEFPNLYHKDLIEIATYCRGKNIKLIFFIPPTHVDLQLRIKDFNLVAEEEKFKAFMSELGNLHDFDNPGEITLSRNNFSDPFHYNDSIADIIVHEIITNKK